MSNARKLADLLDASGDVKLSNLDNSTALPLAGGAMTGAITTNSTFDGVDIATRDAILTSTTTTAGAALPKAGGTMTGDLTVSGSAPRLYIKETDSTDGNIRFSLGGGDFYITSVDDNLGYVGYLSKFSPNGDISFYEDTGTTAKLFWDASAESLGIGTTSPTYLLDIENSAGDAKMSIVGKNTHSSQLLFGDTNDSDIGKIMYDHGADLMSFRTNNTTHLRIDSSGNVGIGVTPESWKNTWNTLQLGDGASIGGRTTAGNVDISSNAYRDSTDNRWEYIGANGSEEAAKYTQFDGTHVFYTAPSGTADSAISWTTAMTIDNSGVDVTGSVTAIDADDSSIIAKVSNSSGVRDAYLKFNDGLGTEGHIRYNHYNKFLEINNTETNGWLQFSTENSERLRITSSGNVGIGTSSPSYALHVNSGSDEINTWFQTTHSSNCKLQLSSAYTDTYARITESAGQLSLEADIAAAASNSLIKFKVDGAERMRIDSSGNVAIGATSAQDGVKLFVSGTIQTSSGLSMRNSGGSSSNLAKISGTEHQYGNVSTNWTSELSLMTYGQKRLYINGSGNVGIGTTSPQTIISLDENTDAIIGLNRETSGGNGGDLQVRAGAGKGSGNAGGDLYLCSGTGTSSAAVGKIQFGRSSGDDSTMPPDEIWTTIGSSGQVLIGRTATSGASNGHRFDASGFTQHVRDDNSVLELSRGTSDGDIQVFKQDGVIKGVIAIFGANTAFGTNSTLWYTSDTNDAFYCVNNSGSKRDNSHDLGLSDARFDDVYATNGTIQTSDRNEKQDIEELNEAEQRVAVACKGLMRKFRWKSAVAEKGDEARTHFGIIAQDLQDAFTDEGLDAGDYAMFISTTWWETQTEVEAVEAVTEELDEDGNVITEAIEAKEAYTRTDTFDTLEESPEGATERTRMGVRYPELLAFIISTL